ncbi:SIR2 family protein [Massilia polaris]|nr:SIR2 family protein [Massilia polaris]
MSKNYAIDPVLVERFAHGNGTIFVGAGISLGARLPSWSKLMAPLRKDLGAEVGEGASYLDIAELYETKHSRGVLIQYLKDQLGDVRFQLTQTHELIVSMPVQRIYTTNFDSLLEQASRKKQINRNVIFNASHVGFSDTSTLSIVKLHGDLDDADSLVISAKDYYSYFNRNPAVADLLKVELQTHTVLFLGYSFSDPNFGMVLGKVAAQSGSVRPLLYSLQLQPTALAMQALHARGVKVIPIPEKGGTPKADEEIEQWLRCFRKALIRYDRRKSCGQLTGDGVRGQFAAPQFPHSTFRMHTRSRIEAGLQSDFRVVVVKGEAGVGKTTLVAAAVADCVHSGGIISITDAFEQVIWVGSSVNQDQCDHSTPRHEEGCAACKEQRAAHQVAHLERILDAIALALDEFTAPGKARELDADRIKRKRLRINGLLQERKVIVVLEDLPRDAEEVKHWLENAGPYANPKSRIIVTSRTAVVTGFVVEVERLSHEEAVEMVGECARSLMLRRHIAAGLSEELVQRLARETCGNPQTIRMAVGLIVGTGKLDAACLGDADNWARGGDSNIGRLFDIYIARIWDAMTASACTVLSAMLAFPDSVPVPSRLLRKAAALDATLFSKGAELIVRFGIVERDVANDTFRMQSILRDYLQKFVDQRSVDEACDALAKHLLTFLGDRNVLCRPEIDAPYWNTLVRDEMAKVDPYWPIIRHVMQRAVAKGCVAKFVMLLTHYMDSRFLNTDRLAFLGNALAEMDGADPHLAALLRIDALAWTYIEEGLHKQAQDEIKKGLELLNGNHGVELRAIADAWFARIEGSSGRFVNATQKIADAIALAKTIPTQYWIEARVKMIAGDLEMMQKNASCALELYREAEALAEQYGGEGHGYQTRPRIGIALLELKRDSEARRIFKTLEENAKVATGRLYGEYGLALADARAEATPASSLRLRNVRREIARRDSGNVLMGLANRLYQEISSESMVSAEARPPAAVLFPN